MAIAKGIAYLFFYVVLRADSGCTDSIGKEFLFSFPDYGYSDQFAMIVTAENPGEIRIEIPYLNSISTTTLGTGSHVFNISSNIAADKLAVRKKGIHVTCTTDISLHAIQMEYVSDYSFQVLPMDSLSTKYMAIAPKPEPNSGESQAYVTITASRDNTKVNLTIPSSTNSSKLSNQLSAKFASNNTLITANLDKYEVLNFALDDDITGAVVESDNPVYVTSGASNVIIPRDYNPNFDVRTQSVISSILTPNMWQKRFIIMPFMNQAGYVIRVMASKEKTNVNITSESKVTLNKAGDYHDVVINNSVPIYVLSDKPVSVAQYTKSTNFKTRSDKDGGNVMISVPSIEQYGGSGAYLFTVPTWSLSTRDKVYNYVGITVPTVDADCLVLDGKNPSAGANVQTLSVENVNYNIISVEIPNTGYHTLNCNNSSVTFNAILYGFSSSNGYGYPLYIKY